MVFEFPETSRVAFVVAVWSVLMTLLSIILFCIETLPTYAMTHCEEGEMPNFLDTFFLGETLCTVWFTLEAIMRFVACPSKLGFWRDFKNIVDVVAIVPYYVTLFNVLSTMSCAGCPVLYVAVRWHLISCYVDNDELRWRQVQRVSRLPACHPARPHLQAHQALGRTSGASAHIPRQSGRSRVIFDVRP